MFWLVLLGMSALSTLVILAACVVAGRKTNPRRVVDRLMDGDAGERAKG